MKEYAKHKGFTLVELLIVVAIIGILAAMMMMLSDEAAYSARAAAIISDMENIKAAAAAYYLDHYREIEKKGWKGFNPRDDKKNVEDEATTVLWGYLTNADTKQRGAGENYYDEEGKLRYKAQEGEDFNYKYSIGGDWGTHWFVWCNVPEERVMKKLQARKITAGLVGPVRQDKNGNNSHHSTESMDLDEYVKTLTVQKNGRYEDDRGYVGICIH